MQASARGTPLFKAPEALADPQRDSAAADVWALGTTLYLLLTDTIPYCEGHGGSLRRRFDMDLIRPGRINPQVDSRLDDLLARALAIDSKQRFADARELHDAIAAWESQGGHLAVAGPAMSSDDAKSILGGAPPSINQANGERLATRALELARRYDRLREAADLMEEAFRVWPSLRDRYEYDLKLWRQGVIS
jgi:serine/threonine-protein kinase